MSTHISIFPIRWRCAIPIILLCAAIIICSSILLVSMETYNHVPVQFSIVEGGYNPANSKQFAAYTRLGVHDGTLYMSYKGYLSAFEDGMFQSVGTLNGGSIGIYDGIAYSSAFESLGMDTLYGYDLGSGEQIKLGSVGVGYYRDIYYSNDGFLAVPTDMERTSYYRIKNAQLFDEVQQNETYEIFGNTYVLEGEREQKSLVCYDQAGNRRTYENEIPYGDKSMIPCGNDLLIHNEGQGDLLYLVEGETGEVVELFSVDCIGTTSAVNIHGDYVYLSFIRYVELGSIGWKSDPDDEETGTYRISLVDHSAEKLSDNIYNGLYIFDDSGIFACDMDGGVYKLDFDGNTILILQEP